MNSLCPQTLVETPKYFFRTAKVSNYGIPLFFSKMALHGDGHLELKKMHKEDFWGIFGIRLGRCPCIVPEKISFLQFYSRFNPNALALMAAIHSALPLHMRKCMMASDWFGENSDSLCYCHSTVAIDTSILYIGLYSLHMRKQSV